jgi:hypothetical protein
MAETTADVRRDIELTRERISDTLAQLEHKANVMQIVKDHPWPALAVAVGAGVLLSGSKADVKAAAASVAATRGASSRLGTVLDDMVANLMGGVSHALQSRVDGLVHELKEALGAAVPGQGSRASSGAPQSGMPQTGMQGSPYAIVTGASGGRSGFDAGAATTGTSGNWSGGDSAPGGSPNTISGTSSRGGMERAD